MENFIKVFEEYCEDFESPLCFITWSSYTAVSAALRNKVWIPKGGKSRIYPNIYVILLAESSFQRKGAPINVVEALIREIGVTKFFGGRWSIQGVMRKLAEAATDDKGKIKKGGSAIIYSEEISAAFVEDPAVVRILTDWYDGHEVWEDTLRQTDTIIKDVCVTLLAASNMDLLEEVFQKAAKFGGLIARTMVVQGTGIRQINSRMFTDLSKYELRYPNLIKHLIRISNYSGPIEYSTTAKKEYDQWYKSIDRTIKSKSGIEGRVGTHAEKLAMILAVSKDSFSGVIELEDIEEAIEQNIKLLPNYRQFEVQKIQEVRIDMNVTANYILQVLIELDFNVNWKSLLRRLFSYGAAEPKLVNSAIDYLISVNLVTKTVNAGEIYILGTEELRKTYGKRIEGTKHKLPKV